MDRPESRLNVEAHSAEFRKELGLWDLVLTQVLFIMGLSWVGVAATLGRAHVIFWLLATLLFYLPSAVVVVYLNRLMPLEGGLYQWAKLGFNEFTGFLVAWNLWLYAIVLTSSVGIETTTIFAYALGPGAAWMADNRWLMLAGSVAILGALTLITVIGLNIGKWVQNAGGIVMLLIFLTLIALPFRNLLAGTLPSYHPFAVAAPPVTLLSLNILGKLGFGAFGGFEYVAVFAGECRDAVRSIGRSVFIATPVIALLFILGTSSVLAFIAPADVDLVSPISQTLIIGTRSSGAGSRIVPVLILAGLWLHIAQRNVNFAATSRLPLVAGWDRLLPQWFTRLHPRWKTPVNSILFVGLMTLAMGLAAIAGVGRQEAFQVIQSVSGIFYALTYLVMFALPLFGMRGQPRAPWWLRAASLSGLLMTALYVTLTVFPIITVKSPFALTAKIIGLIVGSNLLGAAIYLAYERARAKDPPIELPARF